MRPADGARPVAAANEEDGAFLEQRRRTKGVGDLLRRQRGQVDLALSDFACKRAVQIALRMTRTPGASGAAPK
jgi:hypothetical protein